MSKGKYVAYVSSYTQGDSHGIRIYDVDMKNGRFKEKDKVEITNSSYLTISHNGKFLYSITDFGVEAYTIMPDGDLEHFLMVPSERSPMRFIIKDWAVWQSATSAPTSTVLV